MMKGQPSIVALLLTLTVIALSFFSCKKDNGTSPGKPQTNTQKLTGKNFKWTAGTVEPAMSFGSDIYAIADECIKDNLVKFNADGTLTGNEGALKCDPDDPQTITGSWSWSNSESIITITIDGYTNPLNVITNDGTTLKVWYTTSGDDPAITYTAVNTYKKQ